MFEFDHVAQLLKDRYTVSDLVTGRSRPALCILELLMCQVPPHTPHPPPYTLNPTADLVPKVSQAEVALPPPPGRFFPPIFRASQSLALTSAQAYLGYTHKRDKQTAKDEWARFAVFPSKEEGQTSFCGT